MTRSTAKPTTIKLWQVKATETGPQLDISVHWNTLQTTVEDDQGSRQEWEYDEIRFTVPYDGARDGVEAWLTTQEARLLLVAKTLWEAKYDAPTLTADEAKQVADYATQQRIRTALHPLAGAGEEIKILREQIRAVLTKMQTEATGDFMQLENIAVTEIKAAREKEALQ